MLIVHYKFLPLHGKKQNVESSLRILTRLVSENVEEVVEDGLEHSRPVQVALAGHQDLGLVTVSCKI